MKKYNITVSNGCGSSREFVSTSRNARKHLSENYGTQNGARCIVRTQAGAVVSACEYSDENGGKYYYINY